MNRGKKSKAIYVLPMILRSDTKWHKMFYVKLTTALIGQKGINAVLKVFMLSAIKGKQLITPKKPIVKHLNLPIYKL
jgi:hypothetical protein